MLPINDYYRAVLTISLTNILFQICYMYIFLQENVPSSVWCAINDSDKRLICKNTKPLTVQQHRTSALSATRLSAIFLISILIWLLTAMSGKICHNDSKYYCTGAQNRKWYFWRDYGLDYCGASLPDLVEIHFFFLKNSRNCITTTILAEIMITAVSVI